MKKHMKKTLALAIISSLLLLSISGCEKEEMDKAPELPPESSFIMDFSDFIEGTTKSNALNETYKNRNQAVAHVVVWNTVIFVHAAIPVASFVEAFKHDPEPQSDGSWKWSYEVTVGMNTYTANLFGKGKGIDVEWKMYISKTGAGAYTDFLWFTGNSHIAGIEGSWTLYKSPAENIPYIGIDWFNNVDGTSGITYTNIVPDGPENGGYISHGITKETPYNAFYKIYNKGKDNLVVINWNRMTGAGQISNPLHFGDDSFYCWNEEGVDISCP